MKTPLLVALASAITFLACASEGPAPKPAPKVKPDSSHVVKCHKDAHGKCKHGPE